MFLMLFKALQGPGETLEGAWLPQASESPPDQSIALVRFGGDVWAKPVGLINPQGFQRVPNVIMDKKVPPVAATASTYLCCSQLL